MDVNYPKLVIYKIINNINNNNSNKNGISNNRDMDSLFFFVWRNVFLKKVIFYHLEIFNNVNKSGEKTFNDLLSFLIYPYRDYMSSVIINGCGNYYKSIPKDFTLPPLITTLKFGDEWNLPIEPGVLSNSAITSLSFGSGFNRELLPGSIPNTIKYLQFGYLYNKCIVAGVIPSSVKSIQFGEQYNQPILPGVLPHGIKELEFSKYYNLPIPQGSIPPSVTCLRFKRRFSQSLSKSVIPNTVTSLFIGKHIIDLNLINNDQMII